MEIRSQIKDDTLDITLSGKFTFTDNADFRHVIDTIADPGVKHVDINMQDVDFIDSAGLGMLLLAHDEADKYKKTMIIRGVSGQVKRIFDMARFDQFFRLA